VRKGRLLYLAPLLFCLMLGSLLAFGLGRDARLVPTPLLDRPMPSFELPSLQQPERLVGSAEFGAGVAVFNVWASWCVSCRQEHPLLMELAERHGVPVYSLNYRDDRRDALLYLARHGNPYLWSAHDRSGRVGIDWGVYGTPETFIVDRTGRIRYKRVGPITREELEVRILPLLAQLGREGA
jgi:cytochrome c biogenesis protein CcmG, thiol:disulfide interchange protein DsbE